MPFVIDEIDDYKRLAGVEYSEPVCFDFLAPLARGELPTPELLRMKPNPYFIEPPEEGALPDMFDGKRVWTISERVRSEIESLEPDVHQFIPVMPRARGENTAFGTYYLLVVTQIIDAVIVEATSFRDGDGRAGFEIAPILSHLRGNIVLNGDLIRGKHLWRGGVGKYGGGGGAFWPYLFCSDQLAKRMDEIRAEGWAYRPCSVKLNP